MPATNSGSGPVGPGPDIGVKSLGSFFGFAGIVFAGGNLILLGFSSLFILVGLLVMTVAEIVRWSQSHIIFGPPKRPR